MRAQILNTTSSKRIKYMPYFHRSLALIATITMLALIKTTPKAGDSKIPYQGAQVTKLMHQTRVDHVCASSYQHNRVDLLHVRQNREKLLVDKTPH
jgi:hypothetical protein